MWLNCWISFIKHSSFFRPNKIYWGSKWELDLSEMAGWSGGWWLPKDMDIKGGAISGPFLFLSMNAGETTNRLFFCGIFLERDWLLLGKLRLFARESGWIWIIQKTRIFSMEIYSGNVRGNTLSLGLYGWICRVYWNGFWSQGKCSFGRKDRFPLFF